MNLPPGPSFSNKSRARASGLSIKRDVNLVKKRDFFEDRDVLFYNWKADVRANGAIWYCKECKRIIVVQIMGYLKESILPITLHILESVRDHPEGHTNLWSAYQLTAEHHSSEILRFQ